MTAQRLLGTAEHHLKRGGRPTLRQRRIALAHRLLETPCRQRLGGALRAQLRARSRDGRGERRPGGATERDAVLRAEAGVAPVDEAATRADSAARWRACADLDGDRQAANRGTPPPPRRR